MLASIIDHIAAGRRYLLISNRDGSPYLLRVLLRGYLAGDGKKKGKAVPKWSSYLHRFYSEDKDRHLHNHPWTWSFSIPLTGGYWEEMRNQKTGKTRIRFVRPGMVNILGPRDFHRILSLKGKVWTWFFVGGKASGWGFLVNDLYVDAKTYLKEKGEDVADTGPIPDWMLTCSGCSGRFPPPVLYTLRGNASAILCKQCALSPMSRIPLSMVVHRG